MVIILILSMILENVHMQIGCFFNDQFVYPNLMFVYIEPYLNMYRWITVYIQMYLILRFLLQQHI